MTDPRTSQYLDRLRDDRWTDIADGQQSKFGAWDWTPADGSPVSVTQAKHLYDKGLIEIAQRRLGVGHVVMVAVRRKRRDERRAPWFSRFDYSAGRGPEYAARKVAV